MAVMPGTSVELPLTGKFRAVALRVALLPDAPSGSEATVRILADGKEVGHTPAIHAGDQPKFVEFSVEDPKTVTLVADSSLAGTRILCIDPVAVRK